MRVQDLALVVGALALAAIASGRLTNEATAREKALSAACGDVGCEAEVAQSKRTLFGWEVQVHAYDTTAWDLGVTCTRQLWIVGGLVCQVSSRNGRVDDRFE